MRRTTLYLLILVLLVVDALLLAAVFAPSGSEREEGTVQAAEAFAPAEETAETTLSQTQPAQPEQAQPTVTEPAAEPLPTETTSPTVPDVRFALTFAGDCTFGASPRTYYAGLGFIKTVGDDLAYPFRNVSHYFTEDDFSMVNLEGVLAERGTVVAKEYNFRGPTKYAKILSQSSVEAVTLANNHTLDYGPEGYESTVAALQAENVPYVERNGTAIVTTERGLKIGLYGMTYDDLNVDAMTAAIAELKTRGAELIVVAAHWGEEGSYEEEEEQVAVGHAAIDAGAHIVFGTHPHVLQPIEEYGSGIIYYSLGNFSFGGNGAPKDMDTAILRQEVIRRGDGTVTLGEYTAIPTCVSSVSDRNNFQPTPYEADSEGYHRVLAKLSGTYEEKSEN